VRLATANATSWAPPGVDLSGTDVTNLILLPIDTVLTNPVNLSTALTLPTTSRSTQGLKLFTEAINNASSTGVSGLDQLTPNGFTIFAAVDDAFNADVLTQLATNGSAIMSAHYSTNYSAFSPFWANWNGEFKLPTDGGDTLLITYNGTASHVTLGATTAQILRSDISLDNGVMHIIDTVLVASPSTPPVAAASAGSAPSTIGGLSGDSALQTGSGGASSIAGTTATPAGTSSPSGSSSASSGAARREAFTATGMVMAFCAAVAGWALL